MLCPRCGGQWDTTRGICTNCGFSVRMMSSPGLMAGSPGGQGNGQETWTASRDSVQNSGTFPTVRRRGASPGVRQQSGKLPAVRPGQRSHQTGVLSGGFPQQPQQPQQPRQPNRPAQGFANTTSSLIPSRGGMGLSNAPDQEITSRSVLEKHVLRKVQPGTDGTELSQPFPQTPPPTTDFMSFQNATQRTAPHAPQQAFRSTDHLEQNIPATPPIGRFNGPNPVNGMGAAVSAPQRNPLMAPVQPHPVRGKYAANGAPARAGQQPFVVRPLLPGAQLRGNRYRLLELQERQDWLAGTFEAVWLGQDAHRGGAQVMICEVVLPEANSVMTQTLLRTATMSLVNVGRHRHIPALWDAFSDQGRSFFVFERVDGEAVYSRLRYTGHPMPEHEVVEFCLQMTEVLELLAQQSPPLVHGLIRPEHVLIGRNSSQYYLTTFSVVLAGGGTQYVAGMERARLSPYASPEFVRGVADTRSDVYSLIATAYYAVTGTVPSGGASGSIPSAQRINSAISMEFDAILMKGLRPLAGQRYQRPSELRQDLLSLRSVSGSIVPGGGERSVRTGSLVDYGRQASAPATANRQQPERVAQQQEAATALPIKMVVDDQDEEQVVLLPKPEELPPIPKSNDQLNAVMLLGLVLVALIVLVILSQAL